MAKILGLDLGTNSIGWAVVETLNNKDFGLLKEGVRIFSEGNTAKDRTAKRGIRRLYFRRRLRKIETLRILSECGYCPTISTEELNNWRKHKKYPIENKDLINWLRTDNIGGKGDKQQQIKNPYYYRFKAVKEPISKYNVGRAIYHLAQRRGFLSNSLSQESDELIVLVTNKIKEKIEETENKEEIQKEIKEIFNGLDEEFAKDLKVKKLTKEIHKLKGENFIQDVEKLINKKENLGVVKAGIEQLSKEIQISGHEYLGEYLYFLYQSHSNVINNKQSVEFYNSFVEKFKNENDAKTELTNKIRTRYIGRKVHYLREFEQICKVQNLEKIKTKNGKTLKEELENALFYVRPLKSQRGALGKCKMQKDKSRCPLSHPTYEEFRMWQFINNIRYRNRKIESSQFEHLSYDDKMKIVPLFFRATNFKFNEVIAKIDPSLETYEFSHQKQFEEKPKDSLTVESCPTIARLVSIFRHKGNWEDIKKTTFRYCANDRDGNPKVDSNNKPVESKIDIYEVWQILYRSKLTRNNENYLRQFGKEKLKLTDDKKASDFQNLAKRLKEGYAMLSLNAIKKILDYMLPQNENRPGYIYSHAVFFANMKSIVGKSIWQENKDKIIADIIQKLDLQQKANDKNTFVNSLLRDFFNQPDEDKHFPYDDYTLDNSEKKLIEIKAIEYVGSYTWKESPEGFKKEFLNFAENEYQLFLRNVKINGNKSDYFKSVTRKDKVIKDYIKASYLEKLSIAELRETFNIKNLKLSKEEIVDRQLGRLYHPSEIHLYPKPKVIFDVKGNEKLIMPSPYLPDIKNPVANRTLHKLKGLIEYLVDNNIIDERTNIHIEVAKEINGANMRNAITQFQRDRQQENEKYRRLLEEFEKPVNIDTTEKVVLWKDQLENQTVFYDSLKEFIKLKDSKKLDNTQKKELDVLKRRLWDEQKGICMYSGESISMSQLFQDGVVEIEHTFPRSRIPDNSLENKTIALREENQNKGSKIPYELGPEKHAKIKGRLYFWKNKIDDLRADYQRLEKLVRQDLFSTPEKRDVAIQKKFHKRMELEYWTNKNGTGKYDRFLAKEISKKFKNSQLNDTRIITKYASKYLETYFTKKPFISQGVLVDTFKREWGVLRQDEKKSRAKHIHHTVDAIVIACMTYRFREIILKRYYKRKERGENVSLEVPFKDFANRLRNEIEEEVLVENTFKDKTIKQSLKKVRHRGKIAHKEKYKKDADGNFIKDKRNRKIVTKRYYRLKKGRQLPSNQIEGLKEGEDYFAEVKKNGKTCYYEFVYDKNGQKIQELVPIYSKGNTIRERIHEDSFYGAIKQFDIEDGKLQKGEDGKIKLKQDKDEKDKIFYVIRKPLIYDSSGNKGFKNIDQLKTTNIVDPVVHEMLLLQANEAENFSKSFDDGYYMLKPKRIDNKIEKDENNNIVFERDNEDKYKKGPCIKSVRIFSKLTDPIKLKRQVFESKIQHKYKEMYYVNNKNNYLYVVYENSMKKGELKAVVFSLFDSVKGERESLELESRPYPDSIEVLIGKNRINYELLTRNNRDVVLKKNLHVLFKIDKEETIEDILELSTKETHNRLYRMEGLRKDLVYDEENKCYSRPGTTGQIELRHHMTGNKFNNNSEIEGLQDIYRRYFGNNKKMPDSVTEFKVEYPFPFLLMSLNKMDVFIESIDFELTPLGEIRLVNEPAKP